MGMTAGAQEAKKIYKQQYRNRNRDKINAQQRAWNARNPDKIELKIKIILHCKSG